ncbi:MAG: hypothetical protein IPF93_08155 [Saprospiraceae bacterium]|nr:hypothetical protein [Saprospiraceae bacterium]
MLLLLMFENLQNKLTTVFNIYRPCTLFYYVLHFYIIHLIAVIIFFINGFASSQIVTLVVHFFSALLNWVWSDWGVCHMDNSRAYIVSHVQKI